MCVTHAMAWPARQHPRANTNSLMPQAPKNLHEKQVLQREVRAVRAAS